MKIFYVLFIVFVFLTGCSSKNIELTNNNNNIEYAEIDDDLFDDFEDEIELKDRYDPLSGYNRAMTTFNDRLYEYFLTPIAKGYNVVVHHEIRKSVDNFFNNLHFPARVVNNIFQAKFKNASEETGRFVINSTIGIFGLFDPAKSYFYLDEHDEDFGQTLGFYGVGSGPHIVLPLFGPSNLRDSLSLLVDSVFNPMDYKSRDWYTLTDTWTSYLTLRSYEFTNEFSLDVDKYKKLKEDSIDLYPYLRDVYEQYRDKQIKE